MDRRWQMNPVFLAQKWSNDQQMDHQTVPWHGGKFGNTSKSGWYYWKTQRTENEIHLEFSKQESTGSCTFLPVDLSVNPLTKSLNCTIQWKSRSRDRWYQFSKKQLLYIEKSRCRMSLRVGLTRISFQLPVTESCLYMCSCAPSCRVCCGQK